jgi:hypothetical protein
MSHRSVDGLLEDSGIPYLGGFAEMQRSGHTDNNSFICGADEIAFEFNGGMPLGAFG